MAKKNIKQKRLPGRPYFHQLSKRSQYREYQRYKNIYRKHVDKYGGRGMTDMLSYQDYKATRIEASISQIKLGQSPDTNRIIVNKQHLVSYKQGKAIASNFNQNVANLIEKRDAGKKLTASEEKVLELAIGPRGGIKRASIKDYRLGEGIITDVWDALKEMRNQGEKIDQIIDEVFGSP